MRFIPRRAGGITASVTQGRPGGNNAAHRTEFDVRKAVWLFLSNLLEGEFHSETSCIDGVMFPADSFAVCTTASLNSS